MRRAARWTAGILALGLLAIQLARPERTNPAAEPLHGIEAEAPMDSALARVWNRSCADCHSNATRWPWYSHVAPASWFVTGHVNHARRHLNVSEWSRYSAEEKAHRLDTMCKHVRSGVMPLPSYMWLHRDARLSAADVTSLCDWAAQSRQSLAAPRARATE